MLLRAEPIGRPPYRRYIIQNNDEKFWDGNGFTKDFKKGMKYCCTNDACEEMAAILKGFYGKLKRRTFVVPIEVEVYGSANQQEIANYLYRASVLNIETDKQGNGPDGNLVLPIIHWGRIKETRSSEDAEPDPDQLLDFDEM